MADRVFGCSGVRAKRACGRSEPPNSRPRPVPTRPSHWLDDLRLRHLLNLAMPPRGLPAGASARMQGASALARGDAPPWPWPCRGHRRARPPARRPVGRLHAPPLAATGRTSLSPSNPPVRSKATAWARVRARRPRQAPPARAPVEYMWPGPKDCGPHGTCGQTRSRWGTPHRPAPRRRT